MLCKGIEGRILDVGCGEGLFLIRLAKENSALEVWGIDNSNERLRRLEEKAKGQNISNISLRYQEAPRLNFPDNYFDAVVCINVFFNMRSLGMVFETLKEMKRICKKEGRIIFDFRNGLNPLLKVKYGLAKYYDRTVKDLPLHTYTPGHIASIMKIIGLKVKRRYAIGFFIKLCAPIIIIEAKKDEI